jgi:hypothetical protein
MGCGIWHQKVSLVLKAAWDVDLGSVWDAVARQNMEIKESAWMDRCFRRRKSYGRYQHVKEGSTNIDSK